MKEPIKIWPFYDAPQKLQDLSTNGGDEDIEFEEYINKFGHRYDELFFRKRKSKYINL